MMFLATAINDRDKQLITTLISLFTFSKSYHTELIFSDGVTLTSDVINDVHFTKRLYNRYNWVCLPLPWIDAKAEDSIRKWGHLLIDNKAKYDYWGALLGGISRIFDNKNAWFCSELCREALKPYTPVLEDDTIWWSPEKLWKVLALYLDEYDSLYSEYWNFEYTRIQNV